MRREHIRLAITILIALGLSITFLPAPTEAAWERLELVPSIYTGNNTYVPGETIEMVLHASPGELYNVTITSPGSEAPVDNNVQIGESGTASVLHKVGETTPDGQYTFRIWDDTNLTAWHNFTVQAYKFNIETDRDSYLVGDEMKIFWTANKLRDQTLPPDGFANIYIWNETTDASNQTTRTILYRTTDVSPAGSASFAIPAPVDKDAEYYVGGWFNDTQAFAKRHQYAQTSFTIKHLGVLVSLNKPQYSLGSLMFIDIKTVVTNNASSPMITDTGEPSCSIEIAIYEENDFSESKIPGGILTTDSHGNLQYIIQLNSPAFSIDVNKYIIEISAYKWDKAFNSIIVTRDFTVSDFPSLTALLDFNKDRYTSGESLTINVTAKATGTGGTASFTYLYEVRDTNSTGNLFARETTLAPSFSYSIDDDFTGNLWIQITVDDGEGNTVSVSKYIPVDYAFVLVNLDKVSYLANENIKVSYQVVSTLMSSPNIFYTVRDAEGSVVEEGFVNSDEEHLTFNIPDPASDSYEFTIYALEEGIIVEGRASANLVTGYVLHLEFNKVIYAPGNTMAIDYEIIPLGESRLPSTFRITYGLTNGPQVSYQTDSATGRFLYTIPDDMDEGDQVFFAITDIGGSASEVIIISNTANPLWHNYIFGLPLITFFILILALFSTFMVLRQGRIIRELKYKEVVETRKRPSTMDRPHKAASSGSTAGTMYSCENCEKPIEVTTSRRPIEVMCPHCGEIQLLE